jgi:hypothetical protein
MNRLLLALLLLTESDDDQDWVMKSVRLRIISHIIESGQRSI